MLKLSPRLAAVAKAADGRRSVIEVGCDHGFLSVYLALSGCESVTASDIREYPLRRAAANAAGYGAADKIRFVRADGLAFEGAENADTVIFAGLGGETVISALSAAPWTRSGTLLVLQPQSKIYELREWLEDNGFGITGASLVKDAGKLYIVLSALGGAEKCGSIEKLLLDRGDPLTGEWLDARIKKYRNILDGMDRAAAPCPGRPEAEEILRRLEDAETEYKNGISR